MSDQTEPLILTVLDWVNLGRLNPGDGLDETALVVEIGVVRASAKQHRIVKPSGWLAACRAKAPRCFAPFRRNFQAFLKRMRTLGAKPRASCPKAE